MVGNKTCAPQFRAGANAPACAATYRTYCGGGTDKVFTDPKCVKFAQVYAADGESMKQTYCKSNPLSEYCMAWADENAPNLRLHKGYITSYCTADKLKDQVGESKGEQAIGVLLPPGG